MLLARLSEERKQALVELDADEIHKRKSRQGFIDLRLRESRHLELLMKQSVRRIPLLRLTPTPIRHHFPPLAPLSHARRPGSVSWTHQLGRHRIELRQQHWL